MKKLFIGLLALSVTSAYASEGINITSITQTYLGIHTVTSPAGLDGISAYTEVNKVKVDLDAPAISINRSFPDVATFKDFLNTQYCEEIKSMRGESIELDENGVELYTYAGTYTKKIFAQVKPTHISFKGTDLDGSPFDFKRRWHTCPQ